MEKEEKAKDDNEMKKPKVEEIIEEDVKEVIEEVKAEELEKAEVVEHEDIKEEKHHASSKPHDGEGHKAHAHDVKEKKEDSSNKSEKHDIKHHAAAHNHKEKHSVKHTPKVESLNDQISNKPWLYAAVIIGLVIIVLGWYYYGGGDDTTTPLASSDFEASGSARLEFYIMSQCPYGTQVEDSIMPVLEAMGNALDFTIDYIANDNGDGKFSSLHGQPEVDENIRQLCAMKYNPDEYMDFIICQNKNIMNADKTFKTCAESAELDYESVNACFEGEEGAALLSESVLKAQAREASGSPTIYLDGEAYTGQRDSDSFLKAVCDKVEHPSCEGMPVCSTDMDCPAEEGKIPKCLNPGTEDAECSYVDPVKVYMVVLNDKECTTCDTTRIVEVTQQLFPGVQIEYVDISSESGKAVADMHDVVYLPAYILTADLEDTYTWQDNVQVRGAFKKVGENYKLLDEATGATWHVDEEKRKEQEELLTKYAEENLKVLGYDSDKPRLDYFVMAFCPYGNPADEAASELYALFGDKIEIVPHYIISVAGDKIQSLHGEHEGNQGVRELCALEELGYEDFFKFTLAINKDQSCARDADSCWERVAKSVSVDVEAISECETRKLEIAQEQDEIINKLLTMRQGQLITPSASPTFLINGATYEGGRDAESMKKTLCTLFDNAPEECSEELSVSSAAPQGNC